ncbi:MAG TPA: tetratricopeptide repeat protein [Polyangia bacterium]
MEKTFAAVEGRESPTPVWMAGARRRAATATRRLGDVAVPYLMRQLGTAREPRASFARYLLARLRSPRVVAAATRLLADGRADDSAKVLGLALLADLGVPAPAHVALSHPDRVLANAVDQLLQTLRGRADYTDAAHLILTQVPDDELIEFGRATLRHAGDRALPLLRALVDCGEMGDEARDELRALAGGAPPAPAATRPHEEDLERGIALFEQRRFAAAEKLLTRFVHANPEDIEGRSTLGVCLTRRGLPERALPHLIFCAAAEPGEPLHHWNLAAAAQHSGRLARCYLALRAYLQSAGLNEADRREEAEGYVRQYERTVREEYRDLDPVRLAQGEELFVEAQHALRAGRAADAVRELERVLTLVPSHYPTWGSLGAAYLELGRRDQAARCLERALELRPDYDVARRALQTLRA